MSSRYGNELIRYQDWWKARWLEISYSLQYAFSEECDDEEKKEEEIKFSKVREALKKKRKTTSLFQLKQKTNDISIFNTSYKKLMTYQLDFGIPQASGFWHFKKEFYIAGGSKGLFSDVYYNDFRRIS